jgi:hypothetical protein
MPSLPGWNVPSWDDADDWTKTKVGKYVGSEDEETDKLLAQAPIALMKIGALGTDSLKKKVITEEDRAKQTAEDMAQQRRGAIASVEAAINLHMSAAPESAKLVFTNDDFGRLTISLPFWAVSGTPWYSTLDQMATQLLSKHGVFLCYAYDKSVKILSKGMFEAMSVLDWTHESINLLRSFAGFRSVAAEIDSLPGSPVIVVEGRLKGCFRPTINFFVDTSSEVPRSFMMTVLAKLSDKSVRDVTINWTVDSVVQPRLDLSTVSRRRVIS